MTANKTLTSVLKQQPRLPKDLKEWRSLSVEVSQPGDCDTPLTYESAWNTLAPRLQAFDLNLWQSWNCMQSSPSERPSPGDSFILGRGRQFGHYESFLVWNGLSHMARRKGRIDYVLRIITSGGHGQDHLHILRCLSKSLDILTCDNYILPMVEEITFDDLTIGLFPRLSWDLHTAVSAMQENSVEDVVCMVIQALAGVAYIHGQLIGHRDLFFSNFVVEWAPESMRYGPASRKPRVYLIDFEFAVKFPEELAENLRVCTEFPISLEEYTRPFPEEIKRGGVYCPFKLDLWQLGCSLKERCTTGIQDIDQLWDDLFSVEASLRPTAASALDRLENYLRGLPPAALHIPARSLNASSQ